MSGIRTYLEPEHFEALAASLLQPDPALDRSTLHLCAETSDFLRFNQGALRQATGVQQAYVTVAVERGQRRTESSLSLSGDLAADVQRLQAERTLLTAQLDLIADDPWLQRPASATHSQRDERGDRGPRDRDRDRDRDRGPRPPRRDDN
jgi:hypothetical protein